MFKKISNALEEVHKVLNIAKRIYEVLSQIEVFVAKCEERLKSYDELQKMSVEFFKTDDERFKDADQ